MSLLPYKEIEKQARLRASEVQTLYQERVPQAKWLRLETNGAVLFTPGELSRLPMKARQFFLAGNSAQYKTDRIALRSTDLILLDGNYSGGVGGAKRFESFLNLATEFGEIPELLTLLSDKKKEEWKAKLALWDNLIGLGTAQFYALTALSLLEKKTFPEVAKAELILRKLYEGYFLTLLGQSTDHLVNLVRSDLRRMKQLVEPYHQAWVKYADLDLFRTDHECPAAQALGTAYWWVAHGKLAGYDVAIAPLLGGIDTSEAVQFIERHRQEFGFAAELFPRDYVYLLPKVTPIGGASRSMRERGVVVSLYDQQRERIAKFDRDSRAVIIDDTLATGASPKNLRKFLQANSKIQQVDQRLHYVGTRWAVNDVASPEEMAASYGLAILPQTRKFLGKHRQEETLEPRIRTRDSLNASRRTQDGFEIAQRLAEAKDSGRAMGVGFDVFGTLIGAPNFDSKRRKEVLFKVWLERLKTWQPGISEARLRSTYLKVREKLVLSAKEKNGELAEFSDHELWSEILKSLGVGQDGQRAKEMLFDEVVYEMATHQVLPGMIEAVQTAVQLFGSSAVGVFSNSRLPREEMIALLRHFGFVGPGRLDEKNILVSSALGRQKPDTKTMNSLAEKLGVPVRQLIFIGDGWVDIRAAGRTKAIGWQVVPHR